VPTDWTLTASGPSTISGVTGDPAVTAAAVTAGSYDLAEAGPGGYDPLAWVCTGGAQTGAATAGAGGEEGKWAVTSDGQPARVTVVKEVVNDNGGTAVPTDWTLTASGPSTISGVTGDPLVTAASVGAGSYDLAEAGPSGYDASAWVCTGGTQTGPD